MLSVVIPDAEGNLTIPRRMIDDTKLAGCPTPLIRPPAILLVAVLSICAAPTVLLPAAAGGQETGGGAVAGNAAPGVSDQDLAKQLANPVASLISVPFQSNFDFGGGFNGDAFRDTLNIQPVIPISLTENWNLISRTILPIVYQKDLLPPEVTANDVDPNDDQFGLGDTVQSLFLSPAQSDPIWGIGPVLLLPTATREVLGTEKWGAGPTGVVLKQIGPWTVGMLANHIWSFAGDGDREDVSLTFLQPFVSYTTADAWTFTLQTEATYNWEADEDEWTVPIGAFASKVVDIAGQKVSFQAGPRWYAVGPDTAPDWGLRLNMTLLFPK